MKNLTITMLVCLCFYGNTQEIPVAKKHPAENVIQINLYDAYQNAKVYPLSTVAESVEYLPLETTEDCLLGEYLANIFIGENDIIVFDYAYAYRFTPEGKFLNKIGKKGRGPGEYNRPMRIAVDPNQQVVYFEDRGKIVKYGYNGDFLKEYTVAVTTSKILQYSEDVFLVDKMMYSYAEPGERYSMYFFSEQEEKLISRIECPKKDNIPFAIDSPIMYKFNGKTLVKDYWDNTIFRVENPFSLVPYAAINMGRLKHRDKDDQQPFVGEENKGDELVLSINYMSESDKFIFMLSNKGMFFFDKIAKKTYCCEFSQTGEKWYNFENNLTSGPTLIPTSFPMNAVDNSTVVTFNHAYEFFEDGVDMSNPKIRKLLQNLEPDDNPVLVLVKLKN
jgi:hypothetical protein